jgi:hypothetical protein
MSNIHHYHHGRRNSGDNFAAGLAGAAIGAIIGAAAASEPRRVRTEVRTVYLTRYTSRPIVTFVSAPGPAALKVAELVGIANEIKHLALAGRAGETNTLFNIFRDGYLPLARGLKKTQRGGESRIQRDLENARCTVNLYADAFRTYISREW